MKKVTFMLGLLLVISLAVVAQKNNYSVVGTIIGYEGKYVKMRNLETNVDIDSTIIANGQFQFRGHTDTAMLVVVNTEDRSMNYTLLIQDGTNLSIDAATATVSGDRPSAQLNQQIEKLKALKNVRQQVARQAVRVLDEDKVMYDSLVAIYDAYTQQMKDYVDSAGWSLYEANAENKIGGEILLNNAYVLTMGVDLYNEEPTLAIRRLLSYYASASPVVKSHPNLSQYMQKVSTQIEVKTGSPFRDFEAVDYATGKPTTLSAVIAGKVAVVDFWASRCGPCRREIEETLKPLYMKYADSGLVVVGVDIWDKIEDHDKAVKEMEITYPQLVDTDRNNSSLLYGISGVPRVLLIDRNGIILGYFRGEELMEAVEKAL